MLSLQVGESRMVLRPGRYDVGRAQSCHVSLAADGVSRTHARIVVDDDHQVTVCDLGSTNGTFVNGERLEPFINHRLINNDTLQVGRCELRVGRARPSDAGVDRERSEPGVERTSERSGSVTLTPPPSDQGRPGSGRVRTGGAAAPEPDSQSGSGRHRLLDVQTCPSCRHVFPARVPNCPQCGKDGMVHTTHRLPARTTGSITVHTATYYVAILGLPVEAGEPLRAAAAQGGGLQMGLGQELTAATAQLDMRPHLVLVDAQLARSSPSFASWRTQVDGSRLGLFGDLDDPTGTQLARGLGADFYLSRPASPIMFVAKLRFALSRLGQRTSSS
jgi:hypothetical protein